MSDEPTISSADDGSGLSGSTQHVSETSEIQTGADVSSGSRTAGANDNSAPVNNDDAASADSFAESVKNSDDEAPRLSPEDEIGVTLDYEFPEHVFHEYDSSPESRDAASQRRRRARRRRRRREVDQLTAISNRTRYHWMWQFVSGIFTGIVFFAIGVVFVVHFTNLPTYIGVLFLLVSFPPCCMAINRWRYARMARNQQQQALERLNVIRRRHRSGESEGSTHRRTTLPGSDLPPSYNNLGFEVEVAAPQTVSRVSSYSAFNGIAPPTYEDTVKYKQLMELELARERGEHSANQEDEGSDADSVLAENPNSSLP